MSIEDSKFNEWWALYRRDSAMAQVGLARLDDPHTEIIAYRAWLAGVKSQQLEIEAGNSEIRAFAEERDKYREALEWIADGAAGNGVDHARLTLDRMT